MKKKSSGFLFQFLLLSIIIIGKVESQFSNAKAEEESLSLMTTPRPRGSGSLPDFYPFGPDAGDHALAREDDGYSPALNIPGGLPVFSTVQRRAFVNTNGMISFTNGINEYKPKLFPLNGTEWLMLAIFWTDIDISPDDNSGNVYYRTVLSSGDKFILDQLTSEVRTFFPNMVHFTAQFALIATWDKVAPYRSHAYGIPDDARNTFQAALVTDSRHSFVIYRYHNVDWSYQLSTKMAYAQAGVNSGDGKWAAVDGSGTSAFQTAATKRSNVARPGVWAFRLDQNPVLLAECHQMMRNRNPQSTASLRIYPPWMHFSGDATLSLSAPCLELSQIKRADCQIGDIYGTILTQSIPAVFSISDGSTVDSLHCQIPPIPSFATNSTTGKDQEVVLKLTAIDKHDKEWSFYGSLNIITTVQQPDSRYHIDGLDRFVWSGVDKVTLSWDASANVGNMYGAKPKLRFEALVFTGTVQDGKLLSTETDAFVLDDSLLGGNQLGGKRSFYGLKGEQVVRLDLLEARIWERIPQQSPALLMSQENGEFDNSIYFLDGETIVSGNSRVKSKVPLGVILRLIDPTGGANFALTTPLGVYRSFSEHPIFHCVDWINREMPRMNLEEENSTNLGCPPLERQAAADFRFQTDSLCRNPMVQKSFCSEYRPFKCYEPVESRSHLCCYSSGRLCPNCGTTTFASPTSRLLEHIFTDVFPTMSCCPAMTPSSVTETSSEMLSNAPLCQTTFKQVRPVPDNGTLYVAPRLAAFYGDPHLQTLDGFSYTYNGAGLFQLLETVPRSKQASNGNKDDEDDVKISIQGLFEPLGDGTVIQALSIYDGQTVVDVFVREGNGVVVYVNASYLSPFASVAEGNSLENSKKNDKRNKKDQQQQQLQILQSMPGSTEPAFVSIRKTDNFRVFIETVNSTALR